MAMRKPVIASNKGHVPDIVSNSINGLLTDNSPDDICKKILYLKSNPYIAKAIGKKARDTVLRKYDWDTSISSINELLLSVTGHKNSHTGWTIMNHSFG
jgi:glycosyltransferase involved in cell wall biosynthesis